MSWVITRGLAENKNLFSVSPLEFWCEGYGWSGFPPLPTERFTTKEDAQAKAVEFALEDSDVEILELSDPLENVQAYLKKIANEEEPLS